MKNSNQNGLKFCHLEKKHNQVTNQNTNKFFLYLATITIVFILSLIVIERIHSSINKDYQEKLKSIDEKLRMVSDGNKMLEEKIQVHESRIKKINDSLLSLEEQKNKVKVKYHDKIKNVDNSSFGVIDSFFTDRYK